MPKYSIPRHIWRAIYPILIFFGLAFFVMSVATIIYTVNLTIGLTLSGEETPDLTLMMEQVIENLMANAMLFQIIANGIALLIFALMWRKIRTKLPIYENSRIKILTAVLAVCGFVGFNYLLVSVFSMTDITRFFPTYEDHAELLLSGGIVVRIIGLGLISPIVEELLCRGILFNRLSAWMPAWVAALVSTALFAVMHMALFQILYAFVVGLALCAIYMRFRNLWIPIIAHISFNLASVVLMEILHAMGMEEIHDLYLLIPGLLLVAASVTLMLKRTTPAVLISEPNLTENGEYVIQDPSPMS